MPQGKMKVKTKLTDTVRKKRKDKGPPISKRRNAPVTPKKAKNAQVQKLKKIITKNVNASAEEQLRAIAMDGKKSLFQKNENTSRPTTRQNKKK